MSEKIACAFCRTVGQHGAQWILKIGHDRLRVHKPCGRRLAETAPDGVEVKLFPSEELRSEERAKAFWREKFHQAQVAAPARKG